MLANQLCLSRAFSAIAIVLLACNVVQSQPVSSGGGFRPADDPSMAEPVEVISTRQKVFSIPFTVAQLDRRPAEVHLYVSADRGRTWTLYGRQRPDASEFAFRATQDGEVWFALWTVYDAGSLPPQTFAPELKVLIDTLPPTLKLETITGTAGQLSANWSAADENLDIKSLKVHYQPVVIGGQSPAPWQEVAVDAPHAGDRATENAGKLTWWPRVQARTVNVRAEVRDSAGNVQVVTRQVTLPKTPAAPVASRATVNPPAPSAAPSRSMIPPSSQWPADNTTTALPGQNDDRNRSTSSKPPEPRDNGWTEPAMDHRRRSPGRFVSSSPDVNARAGSAPVGEAWPLGERPRMTRTRKFNLRYDVDSVGPEGIESVTLWATRDGGQTWRSWGDDSDNLSPIEVTVEEDGVYGFRVVVKGVNGLAGEAPRTGDPADLWVGVDTTKPTGRIVSAPFGTGKETGHLIINWQAADERLATRPITLQFSESRDGPWTTIAAGISNDGRYAWLVDPRAPATVYLRLEIRDQAGNLHVDQPSLPINLSAMIPRGRVRGFDAIEP